MAYKPVAVQGDNPSVVLKWHSCKRLKEDLGLKLDQPTQKDRCDEILDHCHLYYYRVES